MESHSLSGASSVEEWEHWSQEAAHVNPRLRSSHSRERVAVRSIVASGKQGCHSTPLPTLKLA